MFLFSLEKFPEVEFLDYMVVLSLIFWGVFRLSATVAVPIYIPINCARGFTFLHVLTVCVCDFLLSRVQLFAALWTVAARLLCPWDSPGKITAAGYHALLLGIFLKQESNLCLLCLLPCRWNSYTLSYQGSQFQVNKWNLGLRKLGKEQTEPRVSRRK